MRELDQEDPRRGAADEHQQTEQRKTPDQPVARCIRVAEHGVNDDQEAGVANARNDASQHREADGTERRPQEQCD